MSKIKLESNPVYNPSDWETAMPTYPEEIGKKCDQCSWCRVNGVFCHEHGCPNDHKDWVEGEWVEEERDEEEWE